MSEILPAKGIPSNTIKGLLSAFNDLVPRIRICISAPGFELDCCICTPGKRPCRAAVRFPVEISLISSACIDETEPVTASRLMVP